ncbi:unnamed protein product [Diatraea saccharalis]|uniref:Uncharacterized protein n=1 Tax=Diatraea saccharalis TaxID=40085 RepID=A0A9N9WA98_9NEOP|nr:unnamed protein product [Diatraea saccharalis]
MGLNGGMEAGEEEKKKKIDQDVMLFLRKRSDSEVPRYATRLKTYINLQQKRQKAAAARRHSEQILKNERSGVRKKNGENKTLETTDNRGIPEEERGVKRRGDKPSGSRIGSRSPSGEPADRCGRRRRRRSRCGKKRRRRRSCSRRRRRRRSCRRRRRRSCSRRRRRRSCRRRRKRCRGGR